MDDIILIFGMSITCIIAGIAALVLVFGIYKSVLSYEVGMVAVLSTFMLGLVFGPLPPLPLPVLLYPEDLVYSGILFCFVISLCTGHSNLGGVAKLWLVMFLLELLLFGIGLVVYGKTAGVEFRTFFYFSVGLLYFSSYKYNRAMLLNLSSHLAVVVCMIAVIVLYRLMSDSLLGTSFGQDIGAKPMRVINAGEVFFLLLSWIVFVVRYNESRELTIAEKLGLYIAPVLIFLMQHRTVWVAAIPPFIFMLLISGVYKKWVKNPIIMFVILPTTIFLCAFLLFSNDSLRASLDDSVSEAFQTKHSTFIWRLSSWGELLNGWWNGTTLVNVFGFPFGKGWRRYIVEIGGFTEYSPHSYYVQTILRGGVVKLLLLLSFLGAGIYISFSKYTKQDQRTFIYTLPLFLFISSALYFITYGSSHYMSLFFGIACGICSTSLAKQGDLS